MSKKTEVKKIEVKRIVVQIGDKEAELTIEQAKDLRDALIELMGKEGQTVYIPYPYYLEPYPRYIRTYPTWTVSGTVTTTAGDGYTVVYSLNN